MRSGVPYRDSRHVTIAESLGWDSATNPLRPLSEMMVIKSMRLIGFGPVVFDYGGSAVVASMFARLTG